MKRDMDLIRALLLKLEDLIDEPGTAYTLDGQSSEVEVEGFSENQITYHLELLRQAGFLDSPGSQPMLGISFMGLTWAGHDFIDAVRDDDTWSRTRGVAKRAGGWTFDVLKDIAIGLVKQKVRDLGLDL